MNPTVKNALISVSDKMGLVDFAQGLTSAGVTIYSTGGTRTHLENAGVAVKDISQYTGFPEMMDGRLKTLHPKVFGGILCRHDREDDMSGLAEHGIETFEIVVVNLYPFEATVARPDVTLAEAIEKIDIGGPSLVRAAAKNQAFTTIATSPDQYAEILEEVTESGATTAELRAKLAQAAFARTAAYDRAITDYFTSLETEADEAPEILVKPLHRVTTLRYGENPHQKAALYEEPGAAGANLVSAMQLNGKELSYNNLLDLDAALAIARAFDGPAVSVVKHNNPCGCASDENLAVATERAMDGDPLSAFGSVLGFNREVDVASAEILARPNQFIEAIAAPDFTAEALEILTTKPKWKKNVRLMKVGALDAAERPRWQQRWIEGGMLVQETDFRPDPEGEWKVVTETKPTDEQMAELRFAWEMCRHVKSNAIVLTKDRALCGAGAGQMSRVDSVKISIEKAADRAGGCYLGSDAFFPFPDSIEEAAAAGIIGIIQPGGSKGDNACIEACNKSGIAMVFTSYRHFKH